MRPSESLIRNADFCFSLSLRRRVSLPTIGTDTVKVQICCVQQLRFLFFCFFSERKYLGQPSCSPRSTLSAPSVAQTATEKMKRRARAAWNVLSKNSLLFLAAAALATFAALLHVPPAHTTLASSLRGDRLGDVLSDLPPLLLLLLPSTTHFSPSQALGRRGKNPSSSSSLLPSAHRPRERDTVGAGERRQAVGGRHP